MFYFDLPSVKLEDSPNMPVLPGVYFVLTRSPKRLLYIGCSENMYLRWKTHHRAEEFSLISKIVPVDIAFRSFKSVSLDKLKESEARLIRVHRPLINDRVFSIQPSISIKKQPVKRSAGDKILDWLSTNSGHYTVAQIKKFVRCDLSKDEFEELLVQMSSDGQLDCNDGKFAISTEAVA